MSFKPPQDPKLKNSVEVLQALFENGKSPLAAPFMRWKIWKRWPELVGPSIANVSEPVSLRNGILYVWVKNASWMQQLVFMRDQMRQTLNQKLGQNMVQAVQLTLDRRSVPHDSEEKKRLQETVQELMRGQDEDPV